MKLVGILFAIIIAGIGIAISFTAANSISDETFKSLDFIYQFSLVWISVVNVIVFIIIAGLFYGWYKDNLKK